MGDVTKNFSRYEFECNCGKCNFDTVDFELAKVVQDVRDRFKAPVIITSGCRCYDYNEQVQKEADPDYVPGTSNSQHMRGRAADIQVSGIHPSDVQDYLLHKYDDKYGIGCYDTFTHIDTRSGVNARW